MIFVNSFLTDSLIIFSAFILDLIFGDPRWFPHPVRGIGWLIQKTEFILRRFARTPRAEKIAGIFLAILVVFSVYLLSYLLIYSASSISPYLGFSVAVLMASTALAARGLGDAAKAVRMRLEAGDIDKARKELSMIVGRDTADLDEQEITRAVVETVAENTSDGVIAPLFYMAIGGPALAMAYKAVNTLDSMAGYKNERYINFGWAAARLDDIANYIPARITAVLICFVSNLFSLFNSALRIPHSAFQSPWRIMLRDHANHPSPNSGWSEAAMAGALGIRIGGPSTYGGRPGLKPYIGDALVPFDKKHIEKAVRLMYCTTSFAALGAAAAVLLRFSPIFA